MPDGCRLGRAAFREGTPRLTRTVSSLVFGSFVLGGFFDEGFWSWEGFIALLRNKPFMIIAGPIGAGAYEAGGVEDVRA
jgi:hypothetical protein